MAPEFDLSQVPEDVRKAYEEWSSKALAQGRIRAGHIIRRPDTTETVKFVLVDSEPIVQYADNLFAPPDFKLYTSEKITEELRSIGLDKAEVTNSDQSKTVGE